MGLRSILFGMWLSMFALAPGFAHGGSSGSASGGSGSSTGGGGHGSAASLGNGHDHGKRHDGGFVGGSSDEGGSYEPSWDPWVLGAERPNISDYPPPRAPVDSRPRMKAGSQNPSASTPDSDHRTR